ncbi:arsenate-mycothiol transferase [Friedmanniella endophytica]|uniref:Arsenate-mycothiol transferase n=1 Tax=Microlunatus kandeliicorticis TaxID=1759536 RepID=A0A7W3IT58_9ACTN|nr:low molecular weight phosphatase family protein [Microlunatus kandeliicorticis]MBA8794762.1 arsenate-mycothiol transferase [Microlunatus kandeliicorticis]
MTAGRPPGVLFVCVRNSGKSQLAAALMRARAGSRIAVASAGTAPGTALNALSVASLAELGLDVGDEHPKPVTNELLARADLVVVLGSEARLDSGEVPQRVWVTDEPSDRGIDGIERMRLVRDDIARRVEALADELLSANL